MLLSWGTSISSLIRTVRQKGQQTSFSQQRSLNFEQICSRRLSDQGTTGNEMGYIFLGSTDDEENDSDEEARFP